MSKARSDLTTAQQEAILALAANESRRVVIGGGRGPRIMEGERVYQRLHPGAFGVLFTEGYLISPPGEPHSTYTLSAKGQNIARKLKGPAT